MQCKQCKYSLKFAFEITILNIRIYISISLRFGIGYGNFASSGENFVIVSRQFKFRVTNMIMRIKSYIEL